MADPSETWASIEMQALSWMNMALGLVLLAFAPVSGTSDARFWSAFTVGLVVVTLEAFDEWAEHADLEAEIVGPEAVVLLGGLWLIGFPFFVEASALYQVVTTIVGIGLAAASGVNLVLSAQLGEQELGPPPPRY